jgi:wyosine [tRNA(Phe)-imidazoG37] synthetase (radical SAM superfamily)
LTDLPLAICSNCALLYRPDVRQELLPLDLVMPTVAAGSAAVYRQIHRPLFELTFERLVDGLVALRREYHGLIWVEVMLIQGLNDSETALGDIARVLERIRPDEVHIGLPTRPPAETWVQLPDAEALLRAQAILGGVARVISPAGGQFDLSSADNLVDAIVGIIARHPMRQEELERTLAQWTAGEIGQALAALAASGQAQVVERHGARFWSAASAYYPGETRSLAVSPERLHLHRPNAAGAQPP